MGESWRADEILDRLTEVLVQSFEVDPQAVRLDASVTEDLDLDSIDAIDLAVGLKEEADLELSEDDLKSIRVVNDIVQLIRARLPSP